MSLSYSTSLPRREVISLFWLWLLIQIDKMIEIEFFQIFKAD
jgi:hypothetical protein